MSENETTQQDAVETAPSSDADDQNWDPDEHWQELLDRGLVRGRPPRKEDRADPDQMRPIRYHGTNDDLLRDLGRIR